MRHERSGGDAKGWLAGPWDSALAVAVGFVVKAGEAHTFLGSSDDYLHFVVHSPGLEGEEARAEKRPAERERLGL